MLAALREMLTNVSRHAGAKTVQVRIVADGPAVTLTVEDDGVGPPAEGTPTGGRGLVNLRRGPAASAACSAPPRRPSRLGRRVAHIRGH